MKKKDCDSGSGIPYSQNIWGIWILRIFPTLKTLVIMVTELFAIYENLTKLTKFFCLVLP